MLKRYVQLGAGYPMSVAATETVDRAHAFIEELMGGAGAGRAILGPSTTQLCHMLAGCIAKTIRPGDEIVLAETAHEANAGPWLALERCGATIRWWRCDRDAMELTLDGLDAVLSPRTRIVAFPHVSNLLGGILDVAEITRRAHAAGARVVVDGVAFAPHRLMSVAAWDVDWYVYSTYKVFGPHMAALHGRHDAIAELEGPNHFFIPRDKVPYVFELGGASHEGCAGLLALARYLAWLGDGRDAETSGPSPASSSLSCRCSGDSSRDWPTLPRCAWSEAARPASTSASPRRASFRTASVRANSWPARTPTASPFASATCTRTGCARPSA
jgi:hypothetical protein